LLDRFGEVGGQDRVSRRDHREVPGGERIRVVVVVAVPLREVRRCRVVVLGEGVDAGLERPAASAGRFPRLEPELCALYRRALRDGDVLEPEPERNRVLMQPQAGVVVVESAVARCDGAVVRAGGDGPFEVDFRRQRSPPATRWTLAATPAAG